MSPPPPSQTITAQMRPITEEERTQVDGQVSPSDTDSTAEWEQAQILRQYLDTTIANEVHRQVGAQHDTVAKNMDRALQGVVGNQAQVWREIRVLKQENESLWNWVAGISILGAITVFTWYVSTLIEAAYARNREGGRRRGGGKRKWETETQTDDED
jgi:hypothetical protein